MSGRGGAGACRVYRITEWCERGAIEYLNAIEIYNWQNDFANPRQHDESDQIL